MNDYKYLKMFSIADVKSISQIQYDIYVRNQISYSHEYMVEIVINVIDNLNLIENIKKKEDELIKLIEE